MTATLNDDGDRLSIKKGTNSYTSGDEVPLDVGSNEISIEVTPPDAALLKQTYTVQVFREGSVAVGPGRVGGAVQERGRDGLDRQDQLG